ncbi:TRAP-type C4-dicarboxylate transport system substrate-binding protein [Sphingobium sp. B2D3A]|uniref:TRAP transporter substrate-binding protein DctP n=1 Tax=unclassified Sphingobium TaxID=2611147 RepID=UPI0022242987|nr:MULTISPECIES: TRAP transporter substrate-binding protein DctP [unclassified Sphingobium]MCW2336049.1 TRAP-type C4-dicarboxylate transport system substrate-binding protein [Sphingobium sp. B2D3A]MCW2385807.1 TRAP-type C4-dicarboxylate transport system substrate-binding protein [Sphingobium sp. B2D3D]MCW2391297.1 TRAP-type C4-dicarboxylate transport system substrate-binding protein [Sphingobium sp. B11D3A]MCW2406508.1 TRAP-type C4-dicarboxylate transport system substrate-binding protein [Sphin
MRLRAFLPSLLLLLASCARPVPQDVTELTYATPYSPNHPFSKADQAWMAFVEQRSHGRIRIRPSWSGALLSSDMSMEELRHGVADVGLITPIYARGGAHLIRIQTGFYGGADSIESQLALYRCIAAANPEIGHELEGLKVLAVQGGSLAGVVTTSRQVNSLADLRGLRLRAPTELLSVLESLGADPVNMPMADVYSAMAKGVIDGVIAPGDTFKSLHFAEVARHYNNLAIPRGAYPARAMGMERWNRLSAQDRAILEESQAVWEAALAREIYAALEKGLEEARAQHVTINGVSRQEQARFDALYLRDSEGNARELSRFGIDGLRAFRTARASVQGRDKIQCGGNQ